MRDLEDVTRFAVFRTVNSDDMRPLLIRAQLPGETWSSGAVVSELASYGRCRLSYQNWCRADGAIRSTTMQTRMPMPSKSALTWAEYESKIPVC
jgi:hypothetical protein